MAAGTGWSSARVYSIAQSQYRSLMVSWRGPTLTPLRAEPKLRLPSLYMMHTNAPVDLVDGEKIEERLRWCWTDTETGRFTEFQLPLLSAVDNWHWQVAGAAFTSTRKPRGSEPINARLGATMALVNLGIHRLSTPSYLLLKSPTWY